MLKTYIKARETFVRVLRNDEGASLAEYALIIAVVLIGAAAALVALTNQVSDTIDNGTSCLKAGVGCLLYTSPSPRDA